MTKLTEIEEWYGLISEITTLIVRVNLETKYCVFVEYFGHLNKIEVRICEGEDAYNHKLASTHFYLNYKDKDMLKNASIEFLRAKRDYLKSILNQSA